MTNLKLEQANAILDAALAEDARDDLPHLPSQCSHARVQPRNEEQGPDQPMDAQRASPLMRAPEEGAGMGV